MLNSCQFIGNLGKDPEVKTMQNGDKVANLSIACAERWKDKNGEKQERTTWVPVVIWGPLAKVAESYLKKGSKIFVCGKFQVRKWQDRDGNDRYSTEIVLQGPQSQLIMLDSKPQGDTQSSGYGSQSGGNAGFGGDSQSSGSARDDLDDDIPF